MTLIIAVDGPSAAGKGTLAKGLARELGFHFLDTGALYRMVGFMVLAASSDGSDEQLAARLARALDPQGFANVDLRSEKVAAMASKVAQIQSVRDALLEVQRSFARQEPGAVLDGRDIGTVICPNAEVKFFVTASPEVRAQRRFDELRGRGGTLQEIAADIAERDARDARRTLIAEDAVVIDTSDLTAEQALQQALKIVREKARPKKNTRS